MELVDYRQFASPLADGDVSGPDLEYDADFLSVIELLAPPPVTMIASEDDGLPDQTDWNGAVALCKGLAEKTRDIRVAVRLARSVVKSEDGIAGFAGAIALISDLLEQMWDDVHPMLDAEDNMDATMRLNALNELDDAQLVKALKMVPIAAVGKQNLSLNDIETSLGKVKAVTEDAQNMASGLIAEIFSPANSDTIITAKSVTDQALARIAHIRETWSNKMDALAQSRADEGLSFDNMPAPQFEALSRVLTDISRHIAERMPESEGYEDVEGGAPSNSGGPKALGAIATRADADKAILNVVDWFHRNEPSSPVPIMLERARSMISKSFLEIVEDLGEGGIAEAKKAMGAVNLDD